MRDVPRWRGSDGFTDLERRMVVADVNGSPAVVGWTGEDPYGAVSLVVADERVEQVLVMVNPEKLAGLVVGVF